MRLCNVVTSGRKKGPGPNIEFLRAGTGNSTLAAGEFGVVVCGGGNGSSSVGVPSGWTKLTNFSNGGSSPFYGSIGYKTSPGAFSSANPSGVNSVVWAIYSGVDLTNPFVASTFNAGTTTVTVSARSLFYTDASSMVVVFVGCRGTRNMSVASATTRTNESGVPGSVAIGDIKPTDGQTSIPLTSQSVSGRGAVRRYELRPAQ